MISLIAEYKRVSPSKGDINLNVSVEEAVQHYQALGARMISIVTNEPLFKGQLDFIRRAKAVSTLPILRKDFITTPDQVRESKLAGADAILLIVAHLSAQQLTTLNQLALRLGLQTLVEAHTATELSQAIACHPTLVGINSRNLTTLAVDISIFAKLAPQASADVRLVAESGLTLADLPQLEALGFNAALIGTSLMTAL
jgi:indole-3-glycerol phosphate synthase